MKCNRCGAKMGKTIDNWKKCPKCGLSKFVGVKEPVEKVKETAEKKE